MIRYYLARLVMRYHTSPHFSVGKHSRWYRALWDWAFCHLCDPRQPH